MFILEHFIKNQLLIKKNILRNKLKNTEKNPLKQRIKFLVDNTNE